MESKKGKKQKLLILLLAFLALLLLGFSVYKQLEERKNTVVPSGVSRSVEDYLQNGDIDSDPVYIDGDWYVLRPGVEAYLLMGIDREGKAVSNEGYNDGGQADALLLFVLDRYAGSYTFLQINRDTMTEVEVLGVRGEVVGTVFEQIAAAHFYGNGLENSCENTVRAVSNFLYEIPVKGYAALNMDAIRLLNDAVGGVCVTIREDFSSVDPEMRSGATVTLNGDQAYQFVRSRMNVGNGTNLERMDRHIEYMNGLALAMKSAYAKDPELPVTLYSQVEPYLVTDLSLKDITDLAAVISGYESAGIRKLEGEARVGEKFMEFFPDEKNVKDTVLSLFYQISRNRTEE